MSRATALDIQKQTGIVVAKFIGETPLDFSHEFIYQLAWLFGKIFRQKICARVHF